MPKSVTWLSESEIIEKLKARPRVQGPLFVYSSQAGGWTDHVLGGLVGIDDHGFHRGDGVFEALRGVKRKPYLLRAHLERLKLSAQRIALEIPEDINDLENILQQGLEKFPNEHTLVRLYVTRGAGGFSTSPRECLGSHLFIVISPFAAPAPDKYAQGVRIGKSAVPVKSGIFAITKSLNYLPNVLMKAESLERGLDFTVNFDSQGGLAESSTENIVVLRQDGVLCHPPLAGILRGCTMMRLFELVEKAGIVPTEREAVIREADVLKAQALLMVGTTLDVLPVREYEGKAYPLHPLAARLRALIQDDQSASAHI
ncbi:MAG: aminotransferase class IV [Bdellovibrionaceae bacterium]|nr:aminotransferase class IV [Pseudobdellovibrionaceae bacterium]